MRIGNTEFSGLSRASERLAEFAKPFVTGSGTDVEGRLNPDMRFALQEIVNDFYDGFLSKEDRRKIDIPVLRSVQSPPLVELDHAPGTLLASYDLRRRSIQFPAWLAQPGGVLAWVVLSHETSGHAVLHAYGLEEHLRSELGTALAEVENGAQWIDWFDEAAADCLAVLNLGPTMALGSIASWRAHGRLTQEATRLPCVAMETQGTHPPPVLRAYLMAHLTSKLSFKGALEFSRGLKREIRAELRLCGTEQQLMAPEIFVELLVERRHKALNNHRFLDLQDWRDSDQTIADELQQVLRESEKPTDFKSKHYAAHALAAAIAEVAAADRTAKERDRFLRNLIDLLQLMYRSERGQKARAELQL